MLYPVAKVIPVTVVEEAHTSEPGLGDALGDVTEEREKREVERKRKKDEGVERHI